MARQKDRLGSADLGIDLSQGKDSEVFKWLVACKLFGRPISQEIAAQTFTQLDNDGVVTPPKLATADWQHLVDLLGQGGYRRYDESTASELIKLGQDTLDRYDGSLSNLPKGTQTKKAVRDKLQEFKGVGPTSADIFLREVGPIWNV
jgi:endonuclease III